MIFFIFGFVILLISFVIALISLSREQESQENRTVKREPGGDFFSQLSVKDETKSKDEAAKRLVSLLKDAEKKQKEETQNTPQTQKGEDAYPWEQKMKEQEEEMLLRQLEQLKNSKQAQDNFKQQEDSQKDEKVQSPWGQATSDFEATKNNLGLSEPQTDIEQYQDKNKQGYIGEISIKDMLKDKH